MLMLQATKEKKRYTGHYQNSKPFCYKRHNTKTRKTTCRIGESILQIEHLMFSIQNVLLDLMKRQITQFENGSMISCQVRQDIQHL